MNSVLKMRHYICMHARAHTLKQPIKEDQELCPAVPAPPPTVRTLGCAVTARAAVALQICDPEAELIISVPSLRVRPLSTSSDQPSIP